ncbi:MAG: DUF6364 family protein [Acidobacteriota bacterium]
MPAAKDMQNLTVRLSRQTIQKARVLAAKRATSISALVAEQIEQISKSDDEYEKAMADAIALMEKGFHLGGVHKFNRDELHDRR